MGNETIQVVFTQAGIQGTYHGTLLYTNAAGEKFYWGASFSNYPTMTDAQKRDPATFIQGELAAHFLGGSSPYGRLLTVGGTVSTTDVGLQTYGATWFATGNEARTLMSGADLS